MKTKKLDYIAKGVIALTLMVLLCCIYRVMLDIKEENEKLNRIYSNVEKDMYVYIDNYYIYGTHLNMNGYIWKNELGGNTVQKVRVTLKDKEGIIKEYSAVLNEEGDKYNFSISSNINEGIELENLIEQDYYVAFAKISQIDSKGNYLEKLYLFKNLSEVNTKEYYTLTRNGKNNKIDIIFNGEDRSLEFKSENIKLPNDVYDIVIDAGHGGTDSGAQYLGYKEKDFTLDYSLSLKDKLEELGYKVKLTRDVDYRTPSYGENSRSAIPFETKAKLILSIHINSSNYDENVGGVEIYSPNHTNLDFAKSLADNIVNMVGTGYSINSYMKKLDGVYVRTFTQEEIDDFREEAKYFGYDFYETITTDTNYLFMIRETGGKITGAYTDGRDSVGSNNSYKNSNISAEGYLLELGFLNSSKEIERFNTKKEEYLNAICKSIVDNYNSENDN